MSGEKLRETEGSSIGKNDAIVAAISDGRGSLSNVQILLDTDNSLVSIYA